jgi:hypothetical protein
MKLLLITLTILQSLFNTLEKKTLESDFSISIAQEQSQPMTYTGSLSMRSQKFALEFWGMEAAYDGKTLYIYSEDTEELTLSTPSEEELLETNPFLYAQALLPVCQYAEKTIADKTQITLTPKDQTHGVTKFVLRIVTASLLPVSVEIHEGNKITTLRLNNAQYKIECPSFTIQKPEAFINDLR